MVNLTITVNEASLRQARIKALQRDESVSAVLSRALDEYAAADDSPTRGFIEFARANQASSGPQGRTWTREDANAR